MTYNYDLAGRLIQKLLPNGVAQEYNYDEANQLLSIVYKKSDGTQIDNVSYTYDENSNRITRNRQGAGSVPETPFTATYDANNRMLTFNGQPLSYDDNGNLIQRQTSVGSVIYTWDAKNQLVHIQGPNGVASFKYDAQGRRIEKTINGQTVSFLYDGPQAIAELQGSAIGTTYHTGLQIDEVLARYSNSGDRVLLADALGSVLALTDDSGNVMTQYKYSSFGETTQTGEQSDNSLQYTGRENDNTGLHYYRARYYDPQLKRFITEDPIGLEGGINVYAYVGNSPVNFTDPEGLNPGTVMRGFAAALAAARKAKQAIESAYKFCKNIRCKIEIHGPHHKFGWPFNKRMCHVQLTCWIKGRPRSTFILRFPYSCEGSSTPGSSGGSGSPSGGQNQGASGD